MRAVAALLVALAAGCGGAADDAATAAPGGRTPVVFQHFRPPGGEAPLAALLARFEAENPDLAVVDRVLPSASDEQHRVFATRLEGGAATPDVLAVDVIWVPEFARAGWLRPVDAALPPEERADVLPAPLAACTVAGELFAVPWYVDAPLLYHRADLLEAAGVAPPETWDELVAAVRAVREATGDARLDGFLWQGRQYEGLVCVALELVASHGGAFLEDGAPAVASPATLAGLRRLRGFVEEGVSPPAVAALDEEGARRRFQAGRAVFLRNWPYAWTLLQAEGSPVRGRVGTSPLPRGPGGRAAALGGWQLAVNRRSRVPDAALRLVRFLSSPEAQRDLALAYGFPPSRRSVYDDPRLAAERPFVAGLLPVMEATVPRPVTPYYPMLSQVLQSELSAIVAGLRSPAEAARRAEVQMAHVLALEEEPSR